MTDGLIKVSLSETDYLPKVEEKVREYSRKANIKGFRQGKVPSGVIRKMFGKSILVEEINHIVSHSVSDYIKNNKLRILGDPLPNHEKARQIDWDNQKDFEFEFQVGMVDDFQVEVSPKVKVKSYPIEVSQEVIDETLEDVRRRFGITHPESSEITDNLFGEITSADGSSKTSYLPIEKVNKDQQSKFVGLKQGDSISFDIDHVTADENVRAQILHAENEEARTIQGSFTFKVNSISRPGLADIGPDLFEKVFGKDVAKTEEEFMGKIRETIAENYSRETSHLLEHEIQHHFVDHTPIAMPENFLKQWLKNSSEGQVSDEVLQKEFNTYRDSLKWDLIRNKIADEHHITVEPEEVKTKAKALIAEQFGGPSIAEQLGDKFDAIAENYLSGQDGKGQNFLRLYNQLRNEKIMKVIKDNIAISEKKVSREEFQKMAAEHRH